MKNGTENQTILENTTTPKNGTTNDVLAIPSTPWVRTGGIAGPRQNITPKQHKLSLPNRCLMKAILLQGKQKPFLTSFHTQNGRHFLFTPYKDVDMQLYV